MSSALAPSKEAFGNEKQHVKSPIVLIHGFAAGMGLWFQLLPYLALTGRDVYALDLPGVGSSSDIDQDTLHSLRGQSRGSKRIKVCYHISLEGRILTSCPHRQGHEVVHIGN